MSRATVFTRVSFTLEAEAGPFGPDWQLSGVHVEGRRAAEAAIEKLIAAANSVGIRLTRAEITPGCTVRFEEKP